MSSLHQGYYDLSHLSIAFDNEFISGEMLGWGIYEPKIWRNYRHQHSYFEVCFAYAGAGSFHIEESIFQIGENDLFIARPNETHQIISSESNPLGIIFWSFTLPASAAHLIAESSLLIEDFRQTKAVVENCPHLYNLLEIISEELLDLKIGFEYVIRGLMTSLLVQTFRAFSNSAERASFEGRARIEQPAVVKEILRFLEDNFAEPLKLRNIAAQVHLSERHVTRLIKEATGHSIGEILTDLRVSKAKDLLCSSQLNIGQVASAAGFTDSRYFSTVFSRTVGLTPTQFRKQKGTFF